MTLQNALDITSFIIIKLMKSQFVYKAKRSWNFQYEMHNITDNPGG